MAGDWLKMELELSDKPEVHYIANALNLDPDAVVGKLFRVWAWFNKHTTDGNAYGVTYSLVDRLVSVSGFGEAMAFAGWLEQKDKMLCVPHFDYHTSESAKKRALTAKRVAAHKEKTNADANATANADGVTTALPKEEKSKNKNISAFALPDWVPSESWSAYVEMRKRIKKPMTDHAMTIAVSKLQSLRAQGHDPRSILDAATFGSWQGLYAPNDAKPRAASLNDGVVG